MNIYEKIKAIMNKVQYLAKDDKVKFGNTNYNAISEEKVTAIMHEQMTAYNMIVYPISMNHHREGTLSHVDVIYRMVNCDKPDEYIDIASCGDGADTQDKGAGKAMTYAYKYMWLRTFAIPTGEDPDKICNEEIEAKAAESAKKAEKTSKAKEAKQSGGTPKNDNVEPQTHTCERCQKQITPFEKDGKVTSVEKIVAISKGRFNGAIYCPACQTAIRENTNANN